MPASFRVARQPIIPLAGSLGPSGAWAELLVRPMGRSGHLSPAGYVAACYRGETGLDLDRLMVSYGCGRLRGNPTERVSVNISPLSLLDSSFCTHVLGELSRAGIRPGQLCLELLENIDPGQPERLSRGARTLTDGGVLLALDDFGEGVSSFGLITHLPISFIKLDRACVSGNEKARNWKRVLEGMVAFARKMGALVVAEGIETPEQLRFLNSIGVDYGQGYLLGRPEIIDQ